MDGQHAPTVRLLQVRLGEAQEVERRWDMEERDGGARVQGLLQRNTGDGLALHRQLHNTCEKGGRLVGFDGHKRINGTKIHALVTRRALPVTVRIGSGSEHEGVRLMPLIE